MAFPNSPLDAARIDSERKALPKRWHVHAQATDLPYLQLADRQFEILAHDLLQAELKLGGSYDLVRLMAHGADKGRDLMLYRGQQPVAVVQCKRLKAALGRDDILVEVFKFLLFAIRQTAPVLSLTDFQYQLFTASALTGEADTFFGQPRAVLLAIAVDELRALVDRARTKAAALREFPGEERTWPVQREAETVKVLALAQTVRFVHSGPDDLTRRLGLQPLVRARFFRGPEARVAAADEIETLVEGLRTEQRALHAREGKLDPSPYRLDPALEDRVEQFLAASEPVLVVTGGSGRGKTTWAARLAVSNRPNLTIDLISAEDIASDDQSLVQTLARLCRARRLGDIPDQAMDQGVFSWLDSANRVVIVDGLDRVLPGVKPGLPLWLRRSADLCAQASLSLVLTSRTEAWTALEPALTSIHHLFHASVLDQPGSRTQDVALLDPDAARELYKLYDLPPDLHGSRPLPTPSLIAMVAKLAQDQSQTALYSRAAVVEAHIRRRRDDVALSMGAFSTDRFIAWLGQALYRTADGRVATAAVSSANLPDRVVDALINTDLIRHYGDYLRPEIDEVIEFLMGQDLDLEGAVADLATRRREPLFLGALAMAATRLEARDPAALRTLLDGLIDAHGRTQLASAAAAIARIVPELNDHPGLLSRIEPLFSNPLSAHDHEVLANLSLLLEELRVSEDERLDLLLKLAAWESADDWRSKYWLEAAAPGRLRTTFMRAATRYVRRHPDRMLPALVARMAGAPTVDPICRGLFYEVAAETPGQAIEASWRSRTALGEDLFDDLMRLHPELAVAQLIQAVSADPGQVDEAAARIWRQSGDRPLWAPEPSPVLATTARALLVYAVARRTRANLLLAAGRASLPSALQNEMLSLLDEVEIHHFWSAIRAAPERRPELLELLRLALISGAPLSRALSFLGEEPQGRDAIVDWLTRISVTIAEDTDAFVRIADAVEALLYSSDGTEEGLWGLAERVAASTNAKARRYIIYFAGSPSFEQRSRPTALVAAIDRLFSCSIQAATAEHLDLLVQKLLQSQDERGDALPRFRMLVEKFGMPTVQARLRDLFVFEKGAEQMARRLRKAP